LTPEWTAGVAAGATAWRNGNHEESKKEKLRRKKFNII
jgi:hypothetical protein